MLAVGGENKSPGNVAKGKTTERENTAAGDRRFDAKGTLQLKASTRGRPLEFVSLSENRISKK